MFWAAEIIISTKKITLIDYQKQNFILILVQLIIVKFYFFFFSLRFFGVLDCSYITFMIVPMGGKDLSFCIRLKAPFTNNRSEEEKLLGKAP